MTGNRAWIFDLDNTLHNATAAHLSAHQPRDDGLPAERALGLDAAAASELRQHYWQRYGATLLGLMRHHDTDPAAFSLAHPPVSGSGAHGGRRAASCARRLRRLPGRKFVFSNAPVHYSRRRC